MLLPRATRKAGISAEGIYLKSKRTKEAKTPGKDESESGELSYCSQGLFPILCTDSKADHEALLGNTETNRAFDRHWWRWGVQAHS